VTIRYSVLFATASIGALAACSSSDENPSAPGGPGSPDASAPAVTECFGQVLPERARDLSVSSASALEPYFPTTEFRTASPVEAGFDQQKFDAALAFTTPQSRTQALMVLRHGYVVTEQYTAGFTATSRHESYSMAKSFSSALVGIAIDAKLLTGVDQRLCEFYGSYSGWDCSNSSDARTRITIAHAMNVKTGLEWHEDWRSNAPPGSNDAVTGTISGNMLDYVLAKPVADEPGTVSRYSTGDPALLSGVIQGATGKTALEYAREVLLNPIGIPDLRWNSDSKGRTTTYAGIQGTLREFAKFGFLYLRRGKWDGVQIVPEQWIDFTTQAEDRCNDRYRYLWHINAPMRLSENDPNCPDFPACPPTKIANLPGNAFFAEGVTGQFIFVVPSADIVVARLASDGNGSDYWDEYARGFLERLLDAVAD
jgi:CubicO group peptidase (beta-lactamase class C family)